MTTFLLIIHLIVCIMLIAIVLLQSGKGADIGAAFGGSSQTLFGSRGAATFLNKITTAAAVVFMLTSLSLAVATTKGGSVVKKTSVTEKQTAPATGPIQGIPQPSQPSQPQAPQTQQQKIPQQPQQTPAK